MLVRHAVIVLIVGLSLVGCAPIVHIPYTFDRGGALSPEEYSYLESYVKTQTFRTRATPTMMAYTPQASWIYAFAPGFDPRSIKHVSIGQFSGKTPETTTLAAAIVPYLRSKLDDAGVPAPAATDDPGTSCVISGVVIEDEIVRDQDGDAQSRRLLIEARIQQGGRSIGAVQVNTRLPRHQTQITPAPGAMLIGSLIARAIEPDIAETKTAAQRAGSLLANPFFQVRHDGSPQGKSADYQATMLKPVPTTAPGQIK